VARFPTSGESLSNAVIAANNLLTHARWVNVFWFCRPYFKVLADLLLGAALPSIQLHQGVVVKVITKVQRAPYSFYFPSLRLAI
jgi:hypothetical protein